MDKGRVSMYKIALILDLPEGKLPGFYAQIVKGLAQRVNLFDRDKQLLVLSTIEERDIVLELLEHYHVLADYGFTSRMERHYLYDHLISLFCFGDTSHSLTEPEQAILQIKEHLIAQFPCNNNKLYYAIDRQLDELIERIAHAYHCSVSFDNPAETLNDKTQG
jgi:hypothetical protein